MAATTAETQYDGERAVELRAGPTSAVLLPGVGMTGVSLTHGDHDFLATPGGLDALRAGHTLGLPLLAPWANRLSSWRYQAAGVDVEIGAGSVPTDDNGLPIHGLLVGRPAWTLEDVTGGEAASLAASASVDDPAFPFAHRIDLAVRLTAGRLEVETTIHPIGSRPVPVSFGWHPYLRLPGDREGWILDLPERRHLELDGRGIPTGRATAESAEQDVIGARTFDDLYELTGDRRLALRSPEGASIELRADVHYPFAQVWVPPGRPFAALEPMTAPTDALVEGGTPLVEVGETFSATFALELAG